jgi:hypothetical protein
MTRTYIHLSDTELVAEVKNAAVNERGATVTLISLLAEFDERHLFLGEGCSSLFTYCTQVLRLSEHAAYGRIAAARASRRWPAILPLLAAGEINLTTVVLLGPHLTEENHDAMLEASRDKSKSEIERLIAALQPQPAIASSVRRLPNPAPLRAMSLDRSRGTAPTVTAAAVPQRVAEATSPRPVMAPLAPDRYLIKVTVSAAAHANLKCAQDLLRHSIPTGEPAVIVERALAALVAQLEKARLARVGKPKTPRPAGRARPADRVKASDRVTTRHVPAAVRRSVWQRDGGRCAFVGTEGRCGETGFLEFHHLQPFADRGPTTAKNLSLRCRAHNLHESRSWSGQVNSV